MIKLSKGFVLMQINNNKIQSWSYCKSIYSAGVGLNKQTNNKHKDHYSFFIFIWVSTSCSHEEAWGDEFCCIHFKFGDFSQISDFSLHICLGIKFRIYLGHIWENVSPLKFGTLDMRWESVALSLLCHTGSRVSPPLTASSVYGDAFL